MSLRSYRFPKIDRVVHGAGAVSRIGNLLQELGCERALILTGSTELWLPAMAVGGGAALGLIFMWVFFRVSLPIVVERMSA